MACVSVTNVAVLDNPTNFNNPFQVRTAPGQTTASGRKTSERLSHAMRSQFEISFECLAAVEEDIE